MAPFALLWRLLGPTGAATECYLTVTSDGTTELRIVRDGQPFVSQGFAAHETAVIRAGKIETGLIQRGWKEVVPSHSRRC